MTKPTYDEFKTEQSEAERRAFLARLLTLEKRVAGNIGNREAQLEQRERMLEELQADIAKRKTDLIEVKQNQTLFLKSVADTAAKPLIVEADMNLLDKEANDVNTTEEQREKNKNVNVQMLGHRYGSDIYEELKDMGLGRYPVSPSRINLVKGR